MKGKNKEKAVKEINIYNGKRERWATILNYISSLGFACVSNATSIYRDKVEWRVWLGVFIFIGALSTILLFINCCMIRKHYNSHNYYSESKRITDILLTSLKRMDSAKTNSILRSTYGTVPYWHPIDYCNNVLVYDVHEHLRDICIKIKESIIEIAPQELNDDMVTVDIAFKYPSDIEFLKNKNIELTDTNDNNNVSRVHNECVYDKNSLDKFEKLKQALYSITTDQSNENWKVITSGDRTSSKVELHSYLTEMNSFYNYLQTQGYCFSNDKSKLERENHYIWTSKDCEYNRIGSIVGTVIELKNDNPEKVFVRVFLTITTYGRN